MNTFRKKLFTVTLLIFVGCSFQMKSERLVVFFTTSNLLDGPPKIGEEEYSTLQQYEFGCLQVIGADGKYGSSIQKIAQDSDQLSLKFEVPKLWLGRKYTLRVIAFPNPGPEVEECPFDLNPYPDCAQLGLLENYVPNQKSTEVLIPYAYKPNGEETVTSCIGSCYDDSNSQTLGTERLGPDGKVIVLIQNAAGFHLWKEKNGYRILNATGRIEKGWQKPLDRNGLTFKITPLQTVDQVTNTSTFIFDTIAGRVCPPHVFINHSQMTATDRCLYYDLGSSSQYLNASTGTEATDWLASWTQANTGKEANSSYFEGNIKTCADRSMRLPTAYETTMNQPTNSYLPTGDGISPQWAESTRGVPNAGASYTWTASAHLFTSSAPTGSYYWDWKSSTGGYGPYSADMNAVRCVLPSSD